MDRVNLSNDYEGANFEIAKVNNVDLEKGYKRGFKDGIPIGLGYLPVSFTFGIISVNMGLPIWVAVLISITNLTSAGQFAGVNLIFAGVPYMEMALTQLIINLRYSLMSLSLSQKMDKSMNTFHRLLISFGITDEVFAVASGQSFEISNRYMYGLITAPIVGWTTGTFLGAAAGAILPQSLSSALNIALYGMFIAIIIPPAKHNSSVLKVILLSVLIGCILRYTPVLNKLSEGFVIIICAVAASAFGAKFFPVKEEDND